MGQANTKNTVDALAQIANDVVNENTQNSKQKSSCSAAVHLDNCQITGKLQVENLCSITDYSKMIQKANTNTNVSNDIAQKLAQQATSSLGFGGIGVADASNSASVTATATSDIKNVTKNISEQAVKSTANLTCENSLIEGNVDVENILNGNFISNQFQNSTDIQDISNKISQSVTQTATAKVTGIAGTLIALAILIIAIGYSFAKPITAAVSSKYIMVPIVLVIFGIILTIMYLHKSPPFFNDIPDCASNKTIANNCDSDCINCATKTIDLNYIPLKYTLPIFTKIDSGNPSLWGIYLINNVKNNGGVEFRFIVDKNLIATLVDSQASKVPTDKIKINDFIDKYKSDVDMLSNLRDALLANTSSLSSIPRDIYLKGESKANSNNNGIYVYTPDSKENTIQNILINGISSSTEYPGTLTGSFGICNSNEYKFQHFMRKIGGYILIGIAVIVVGIVFIPAIIKKFKKEE